MTPSVLKVITGSVELVVMEASHKKGEAIEKCNGIV